MLNDSKKSNSSSSSSSTNTIATSKEPIASSSSSFSNSSEKFKRTMTQLSSILSKPSSEELKQSWFGVQCEICESNQKTDSSNSNPIAIGTKLKSKVSKGKEKQSDHRHHQHHSCPSKDQITLKDFKKALDSGKVISGGGKNRGIPMRLVVLTLKASWHENGTWPLLGSDEIQTPEKNLPNSIHSSKVLLKPSLNSLTNSIPEIGPPMRPDPDPDEISEIYRIRGVHEDLLAKPLARNEDW